MYHNPLMYKSVYVLIIMVIASIFVSGCRITGGATSGGSKYTPDWRLYDLKSIRVNFEKSGLKRFAIDVVLNRQGRDPHAILWQQSNVSNLTYTGVSPKNKTGLLYPSVRYKLYQADGITLITDMVYRKTQEFRAFRCQEPGKSDCAPLGFYVYSNKSPSHITKPQHQLADCDSKHLVCKTRYILEVSIDETLADLTHQENLDAAHHYFQLSASSSGPLVYKIAFRNHDVPKGYKFNIKISEIK